MKESYAAANRTIRYRNSFGFCRFVCGGDSPAVSYREVYDRMKRVGMIENYIVPYYDVLHTMSRKHVIDDMLECLKTWEENV